MTVQKNINDNEKSNSVDVVEDNFCEVTKDIITQDVSIKDLREELNIVDIADGDIDDEIYAEEAVVNVDDAVELPDQEELTSTGDAIEPATGEEDTQELAEIAEQLAEIETAAGEGSKGSSSAGGYGYQSSFVAAGVIALDDVGAINPTELLYGITNNRDDFFISKESVAVLSTLIPVIEVGDYQVSEDGSVTISAFAAPESEDGDITVTISGIPSGWDVSDAAFDALGVSVGTGVFDATAGTWTISLTNGTTFSGGPTFIPPADSDVDALDLVFTVSESNPAGQSGSSSSSFDIIVDAVADDPTIDAKDDAGLEGTTLDIDVSTLIGEEVNNGSGADDGSENIVSYEISGIPAGFILSAGIETAPGSGVYVLTPAEIVGLQITPNDPNFFGSIDLTATVYTTENSVTDTDFDLANNNNQASDIFTLTWNPLINPPAIEVNNGVDNVIVKEDNSIDVPINAQLGSNPAAGEYLTIIVTGIDASWGSFSAPIGTYDSVAEIWTVTLPAGESLDTIFTFAPNGDSDIDLTGLVATVIATDPAAGLTANSTDDFNVIVDAVADVPDLDTDVVSGQEGSTIPLNITTSVNDTDGSEVIEVVKIGNLPAGTTLSAGTYDDINDVWLVDVADLSGLGINIPDGLVGEFELSIEAVAFEENTNGTETDITDNRASAFDTIKISVRADDVPIVKNDEVSIDESDLAPTTAVTGSIIADFGNDNPGSINGNDTYFIGGIASGGVPVVVAFDAVTNTYSGSAGSSDIFTLVIQSNGDYEFTLIGTIDHPDTADHNDSLPLEFGVRAIDSDGDVSDAIITVNVLDDGLTANDDYVQFNVSEGVIDGNVVANDDLSNDQDNTVTQIKFGSDVVDIPTDGTDITINGDSGALTINSDGDYSYEPFDTAFSSTYTFIKDNPAGSDNGGDIKNVTTSFDSKTNEFSFSMKVEDISEGFTLAINGGANPKGHEAEMALFYFDASGVNPIINVYAYNGLNTQTSWFDGSKSDGVQPADAILNSIANADLFSNVSVTTDGLGNKIFSFTMDATIIQNHNTISGPDGEWSGVAFEDAIGMWLHPVEGLGTSYDADGFLTDWSIESQGWYDTSYQNTTETHAECVQDIFEYVLTDGDGDGDSALLKIKTFEPNEDLIVGQNISDNENSDTPHLIGDDKGVINGGSGSDILVGDTGGSFIEQQTQDYNFVFILDVSGSMGDSDNDVSRISLLKDAVENLLNEFADYKDGQVKIHITPFSTDVQDAGTFTVTDAAGLTDALDYLQALDGNGLTNYEAPLAEASAWLQSSQPLNGNAITTTYFISDGAPNRYLDDSGDVVSGNVETVIGEITGSDGSDEIALLHSLNDDVIAVGINVSPAHVIRLNNIDSNGDAINIYDPADLTFILAETKPLDRLSSVGDDVIDGGMGADIIFGDVLFTDDLADIYGINIDNGAGWEVFEHLENGESTSSPDWSRDDTIAYIRSHTEELSQESVNSRDDGRIGGDDVIDGGAGADIIFGQEGNDIIAGGAGTDILYGGTGADIFLFKTYSEGVDTIKDFDATEGDVVDLSALLTGYDALTQDIADFVISTEIGGDTIISIDQSGESGVSGLVDVAILEGVTGFDLDTLTKTDTMVA